MIRFRVLSAILLLMASASALAEIQFAIGEPAANSTKSGIGQISGWAVSDVRIVTVEAFIDGVSLGLVPYGGTRQDVAAAFPDIPNSEFSGWAIKWNYSLLDEGEHVVTIVIVDEEGAQQSKDVIFNTTGFRSEFIPDPEKVRLTGAVVSTPEEGRIVIAGAEIDDEIVDIELLWDTASQQFQIDKIIREEPENENQAPTAYAGPSFSANTGTTVVVEGTGSDVDGSIESYSWAQVSGMAVTLEDTHTKRVSFQAPEDIGTIRLRLTVTDNIGATDADDALIEIVDSAQPADDPPADDPPADDPPADDPPADDPPADDPPADDPPADDPPADDPPADDPPADDPPPDDPPPDDPPPEPEPENQAPTANAGPNFTVESGDAVEITGSGNDGDGNIVSWNWTRTSGLQVSLQNGNTATVSFTAPNSAGTIQLRLTVTDNDGATDTDNVTVTVEEPPPPPPPNQSPSANAGSNKTVSQGESVTVSGSGSDPDGNISEWSWEQVSGPDVSLSNANSQDVQFTAPDSEGEIRLRLTVTDNDGATDSDEVIVTVEGATGPDATTGETLQSMLDNVNDARGQDQVCGSTAYPAQPALSWSSSLASIAAKHSKDMAREGYFSHTSIDGTSMGNRVFPYWSGSRVGENIAASSADRSDSYVVGLWMDSPGHCSLIMDPNFTHVGAGAGHNPENGYDFHHFWTLDFGG